MFGINPPQATSQNTGEDKKRVDSVSPTSSTNSSATANTATTNPNLGQNIKSAIKNTPQDQSNNSESMSAVKPKTQESLTAKTEVQNNELKTKNQQDQLVSNESSLKTKEIKTLSPNLSTQASSNSKANETLGNEAKKEIKLKEKATNEEIKTEVDNQLKIQKEVTNGLINDEETERTTIEPKAKTASISDPVPKEEIIESQKQDSPKETIENNELKKSMTVNIDSSKVDIVAIVLKNFDKISQIEEKEEEDKKLEYEFQQLKSLLIEKFNELVQQLKNKKINDLMTNEKETVKGLAYQLIAFLEPLKEKAPAQKIKTNRLKKIEKAIKMLIEELK